MSAFWDNVYALAHGGWLGTLAVAAAVILVTAVVAHLSTRFLRHLLRLDGSMLPASSIFVNIARTAVWVAGGCILLSTCFNVDVSAAIAALGIGGIAISLGFQDTISNLIGGLQVSLMRIVSPGDNIEVGTERGVVSDVTWRHTAIVNAQGERVVIPNSIINKTALVQLPPPNALRIPVSLATDGDDLDGLSSRIEAAAAAAARTVSPVTKDPQLILSEVTDWGFHGTLLVTVEDAERALEAKDAVVRAIAPLTRQQGR